MSLIGTLEQFSIASVLQRVETYAKTGLFVVKQGNQWVEFYFRDGRLMCVGPLYTNATLGDRLLQAGVISAQALRETMHVIGSAPPTEMRMALTLMDLGYVGQEDLRTWASSKACEVLQAILAWSTGEMYFEDDVTPPADRLLVALSSTALLASISSSAPVSSPALANTDSIVPQNVMPEQPRNRTHRAHVSNAPTLLEPEQFFPERIVSTPLSVVNEPLVPVMDIANAVHSLFEVPVSPVPPPAQPVVPTIVPRPIDTSFMRPEMVLYPQDISALCEQNPQIQLSPEQWRLLTRVDGETTLQTACQELGIVPELVCKIAGELIGLGLIYVAHPSALSVNEPTPVSREFIATGPSNGYSTPHFAPTADASWSPLPSADALPQFSPSLPFETQSQWGNGGNGATFVPGRGWVTAPQPLQPLPSSGPLATSAPGAFFAPVGGY